MADASSMHSVHSGIRRRRPIVFLQSRKFGTMGHFEFRLDRKVDNAR